MSSTAVALAPVTVRPKTAARVLSWCAASLYALVAVAAVLHHEPWADEAQAWLLARDASLPDLWIRLMHYEGSPGLWQTLLHGLVRVGLPYSAYNLLSALFGFAAVWLLIRYAPLPLPVRLLLPFTYYLCYQYSVIARSYVLLAPLLFATAMIFDEAAQRPYLFTTLLALIAGISVHGVVISASIWMAAFGPFLLRRGRLANTERNRILIATLIYTIVMLGFIASAWPAKDVAFAEHRGLANFHFFWDVFKATIGGAFTGEWISSLVVLGLSAPLLWRGGGWLFFLVSTATLILFGTLVYAHVWHFGIFFLMWLFAIWISALRAKITVPALIALGAVIACQCGWTAQSIYYDWNHRYSASRDVAAYFHRTGIPAGGLYAIGYPSTAVQPYFAANIFSNFNGDQRSAYWDWSKRNPADDPGALFLSKRRELVLVGYKDNVERVQWDNLLKLLGYEETRHFEGNTFWQSAVLESESYDLYRAAPENSSIHTVSAIDIADPSEAIQLLKGFYGVEMRAWRWAAKDFSVALKPPVGAETSGAKLVLKLYLPASQIQTLGPITLRADVDGFALSPRTFSAPGSYVYSADIPPDAMRSSLAAVNFHLDKALSGMKTDPRELGTVVTSVGFVPVTKP